MVLRNQAEICKKAVRAKVNQEVRRKEAIWGKEEVTWKEVNRINKIDVPRRLETERASQTYKTSKNRCSDHGRPVEPIKQ